VVPARDLPSFTPGKDFRSRVVDGPESDGPI
jgi:hypothetical protein